MVDHWLLLPGVLVIDVDVLMEDREGVYIDDRDTGEEKPVIDHKDVLMEAREDVYIDDKDPSDELCTNPSPTVPQEVHCAYR
jgi:hypothetical protein